MENILFTIFDVFNFGLLVFLWWFTVKNYKALPQTIPIHFDFDGKADNFGSKKYFFLMPVLGTLLFMLFAYVVRDPESANFPVKITPENEWIQFLIMKIFTRWIYTLIMMIFLNSQDYMFRYSFDENVKPKIKMTTAILSILVSVMLVFIITSQFK